MSRLIEMLIALGGSLLIFFFVSLPILNGSEDAKDLSAYLAKSAPLIVSWIALYFSVIRTLVQKPAFKVKPSIDKAHFNPNEVNPKEGEKYYFRLKVSNKGQTTAKNCVGRLLEVRNGRNEELNFDPICFFWEWQDDDKIPQAPINIYSRDATFLDIIKLTVINKEKPGLTPLKWRISSRGQPLHFAREVKLDKYTFKIGVYGDEVPPYLAWYELECNYEKPEESVFRKCKQPSPAITPKKDVTINEKV